MNHKKIQTTVKTNGDTTKMALGWVSGEHLARDIGTERERFAKLALVAERRTDAAHAAILSVEVTDKTIVAIYQSGIVRVINYVPEG